MQREDRERKRGRKGSGSGSCKKNTPPKAVTGESRGTDYHKFLQTAKPKFGGFRSLLHLTESSKAGGGAPGEEEGRGPGADSRQHGVGILWVELGKNVRIAGVHLEEGILPLQGQRTHQEPLNCHS